MAPCKLIYFVILALLAATTQAAPRDIYFESNGGQYVAVLISGDIDDFGYNYIVNAGRVKMEQTLNMSSTKFYKNINNNVSAIAVSTDLVQRNYRLIISTSFVHGNAMDFMAREYTNVSFVQTAIPSSLPNLSQISFTNYEYWFIIGVIAGVTTINGKVGYIHPGSDPSTGGVVGSINGFYSGVMWANQSLEVWTMFSGGYLMPDQAAGASSVLLNQIGVGSLTGQQDDLTVPIAAMDAGLLAIGTTGFSLRQIYGELVATSMVRDWSIPFSTIAQVAVTGEIFKSDNVISSIANGAQGVDARSHLVSDEQWATIQAAVDLVRNGNEVYLCGAWLKELGVDSSNCVTDSSLTSPYNNEVLSGIHNLGTYVVPLFEEGFPKSTRVGIIAASGVLLLFPIACAIMVIVLLKNPVIRSGSPFFFMVTIVGSIFVYVGVIMWPLSPSVSICRARIWLPSLGATIAISALIVKNLRIFLVFYNPFKFRAANIGIKVFFSLVLALVAVNVIILAVYTGAGPEGVTIQQGTNGLSAYETRHICATSHAGNEDIWVLLGFHIILCIMGSIISFLLRNVTAKEFDERKAVGMAIYVVTFCLIIVTILISVTSITNEQLILFISVALLISNTALLGIIFGSRFVDLFAEQEPQFTNTKSVYSTSGTGTDNLQSSQSKHSKNSRSSRSSQDEVELPTRAVGAVGAVGAVAKV